MHLRGFIHFLSIHTCILLLWFFNKYEIIWAVLGTWGKHSLWLAWNYFEFSLVVTATNVRGCNLTEYVFSFLKRFKLVPCQILYIGFSWSESQDFPFVFPKQKIGFASPTICIPISLAVCQKLWKFNIENISVPDHVLHPGPPTFGPPPMAGECQSIDWQGQVVCDSWQLLPAGCHRLNLSSDPGWSPRRHAATPLRDAHQSPPGWVVATGQRMEPSGAGQMAGDGWTTATDEFMRKLRWEMHFS